MDADMENKTESVEPSTTNDVNENNEKKYIYKSVKTKSYLNKNFNANEKIDFKTMSHEQLVTEAEKMKRHIFQLKNLLIKANSGVESDVVKKNRKPYRERPFDFNKYNKRHVLLKFAYFGWDYQVKHFWINIYVIISLALRSTY